jgi:hypothetical protein
MLTRIIEIMWLIIAIVSTAVFFYLLFTDGFVEGKAWVYLISVVIATGMYYIRRRQRLRA